MANTNAPSGLTPSCYLNGSMWNGQARMYYIASTDTHAYAIGDPVTLSGTGDSNGVPGITLATAGSSDPILGSVVGAGGLVYGGPGTNINNPNTTVIPGTKTTAYYVLVADDPNILFEVQEGGAGPTLTASSVTKNVNLLSGTNSGYLSGWQFDDASVNTTATLQLRLMGLVQRSGNAFGSYARWLVKINQHSYAPGTAGV